MDLSHLDPKTAAEKGATLHLKNPFTLKPLFSPSPDDEENLRPVEIDMRGVDSPTVQEKRKEIERRRLEGEDISEEQASLELTVEAITGWRAISMPGQSEDAPFTKENVRKLLSHPKAAWVFEQTSPFSLRRSNFLPNAPRV